MRFTTSPKAAAKPTARMALSFQRRFTETTAAISTKLKARA